MPNTFINANLTNADEVLALINDLGLTFVKAEKTPAPKTTSL